MYRGGRCSTWVMSRAACICRVNSFFPSLMAGKYDGDEVLSSAMMGSSLLAQGHYCGAPPRCARVVQSTGLKEDF